LYCDESNVQNFCEGLKGNDDDSWRKTERKEPLSDKSQFHGLPLVSENSYEVKLESSIHIEKENGKKREPI